MTGYKLYDNTTFLASSTGAATTYTLSGLKSGTIYTLTARATDAAGNLSNPSNAVSVTTDSATDVTPPPLQAGRSPRTSPRRVSSSPGAPRPTTWG